MSINGQALFDERENLKPLREGRAPQMLTGHRLEPQKLKSENEEARRRLDRDLNKEDSLVAYINYIRKLKELYPSGSKQINEALHDAAMHFVDVPAYKNDPRLLNIFLELADKEKDPREVFSFMQEHMVGNNLPKFHLAMAATFERSKDFQQAEISYTEAVNVAKRKHAKEDFDLAMTHLAHYKRRMARRLQESRALHGPSSPSLIHGARPANRQFQQQSQLQTHHHQQQQQQQHHQRPPIGGGGSRIASSARPTAQSSRPQFSIFEDRRGGGAGPSSSSRPVEAAWPSLETDATAVENHGPARPWTEAGTIPQRRMASAPASASVAPKPAPFQIWTEPSHNEDDPHHQIQDDHEDDGENSQNDQTGGLESQMQRLEIVSPRSTVSRRGGADRTPMASAAVGASTRRRVSPPVSDPHSTPTMEDSNEDQTINTRFAYNEMFAMFASPSMSVQRRQQPMTAVTNQRRMGGGVGGASAVPPMFTPAIGLANRLANERGGAVGIVAETEDGEPENVSPNIMLRPGESAMTHRRPTTQRRPPMSARPVLATIEHHEEGVSPSFRREANHPPPVQEEKFQVYHDVSPEQVQQQQQQVMRSVMPQARTVTFAPASSSMMEDDAGADVTYDGGTFGISRVLSFDPSQSVNRPARTRLMNDASSAAPSGGFHIFKD